MLREKFKEMLKNAMLARENRRVSALRLIIAALKDKDIAARGNGKEGGISDDEIMQMLQSMIKQRNDSITLYKQGNREDLAKDEQDEINIISEFLPKQLDEAGIVHAAQTAIKETGAQSIKDMGKVMAYLREKYSGQMDFAKASNTIKEIIAKL